MPNNLPLQELVKRDIKKTISERKQSITFGDNYTQDIGLTTKPSLEEVELTYAALTAIQLTELETFFDLHGTWDKVTYTLPYESTSKLWHLKDSLQVTPLSQTLWNVKLGLTQAANYATLMLTP